MFVTNKVVLYAYLYHQIVRKVHSKRRKKVYQFGPQSYVFVCVFLLNIREFLGAHAIKDLFSDDIDSQFFFLVYY